MANKAAEEATFHHVFLVSDGDGQLPPRFQIMESSRPRQMRAHRKSRLGCVACKKRRVKCDERQPCSNCVRRKERCVQAAKPQNESISPSLTCPRFEASSDPKLNLLHFELFSHFEKQTLSTISFPEVWPVILQYAFQEEFVMSTILCVAAKHLAIISPQGSKYIQASEQLLPKSLRLFRQSLSYPFSKNRVDALVGTSFLVNYISWCDLEFLDRNKVEANVTGLDLSQDQLLLLGPGVLQVLLEAMPIMMERQSVFISTSNIKPRLNIENALKIHRYDPSRYVKSFMKIWDDSRYHIDRNGPVMKTTNCGSPSHLLTSKSKAELSFPNKTDPVALVPGAPSWMLPALAESGFESSSMPDDSTTGSVENTQLCPSLYGHQMNSSVDTARVAYEKIARRLSPILCCVSLMTSSSLSVSTQQMLDSLRADFQRMVFAFPIFCCKPFLNLTTRSDSRALVLLLHFYRAAQIILNTSECWWAHERSHLMERLLLREINTRGLSADLEEIEAA